jgi:hypothetical protein
MMANEALATATHGFSGSFRTIAAIAGGPAATIERC